MSRRARKHTTAESAPRRPFGMKLAIAVGSAALLVVGLASVLVTAWPRSHGTHIPKAVIVDQLALTDPNPEFVKEATSELEEAGYQVDYVPPDAVTVDYYRTLPKRGYDLVILRSHSTSERIRRTLVVAGGGTSVLTTGVVSESTVGLFTNEPYSTQRHIYEQREVQVSIVSYPERGIGQRYFGLHSEFIKYATEGRFKNATVVLMGCGGLISDTMAKAFIDKGAGSFISWNNAVTAAHTDAATQVLLEHVIRNRGGAADAVAQTMAEVGPDPAFGARLAAYP